MDDEKKELGGQVTTVHGIVMSENVGELFAAIAKAQAEFGVAKKTKVNPFYKSTYADMADVDEAIGPALAKNAVAALQAQTYDGGFAAIVTLLGHPTGQYICFPPFKTPVTPRVDKETKEKVIDAHGVQSACTLAKRGALSAALKAVTEDDDGNAAVGPRETKSQTIAAKIPPADWHPVDGPPPPSDEERPPDNDDSVRFYQADGSHVDVPTVQFGKNKGTPINELSDKSLQWYLDAARENVADPSKVKWRAKESAWLNSLTREQDRRAGK